jgi:hypothetical protein
MHRIGPLVFLCMGFSQVSSFASVTAFSTYGPGDVYDSTRGYTVGLSFTGGASFLPEFTGPLGEIDFALGNERGSNTVNAQLLTDVGGVPGVVIENYTLNVTNSFASPGSVVVGTSTLHPVLQAGTHYWLMLSSDSASNNPWYPNSIGVVGPQYEAGTIKQDTLGTFRVIESSVFTPEPAPLAITALGLAAVTLLKKRRAAAALVSVPR